MRQATTFGVLIWLLGLIGCQPKSEPATTDGQVKDTGKVNADDSGGEDDSGGTVDGADLIQGGNVNLGVISAGQVAVDASGLNLMSVGQADGVQLESLQYRILSIQVCESVELSGTATGGNKGCMEIYSNGGVDYDNFGYTEAKADTTGYIDLQDPEAVAGLSATLQLNSTHVREYNWGLIYFAQPIKVKASVPLNTNPAVTLYTKDVPWSEELDHNDIMHFVNRVDNFTTGPSELAIVRHNNGGTVVKFAKPLVITEEDIKSKKDFKLDLVFNPDGIVKSMSGGGMMTGGAGAFGTSVQTGATFPRPPEPYYGIDVPMINFSPIVHAADQKIVREQYVIHYHETYNEFFPPNNPVTEDFDIRVELYSLKGDPEKGIYGVDTQILYTAATQSAAMGPYDPTYIVEAADGEIDMQNFAHKSVFKGFKRLAAPGDTGIMKILSGSYGASSGGYCVPADMNPTSGCPETIREVPVTYTFVRVDDL